MKNLLFLSIIIFLLSGFIRFKNIKTILLSPTFDKYPVYAQQLINSESKERFSEYSPGYTLLFFVFNKLGLSKYSLILFQLFLGMILSVLFFFVGFKISNSLYGGLLSGIFYAIFKPAIVYEATLEPDFLIIFFYVITFYFLITKRYNFSAIFLFLIYCLRQNVLIFIILSIIILKNKLFIKSLLNFFIIPVILWSLFIFFITGRFILSYMNPEQVFFQSNNPISIGTGHTYPVFIKDYEIQESPKGSDITHIIFKKLEFDEKYLWYKKSFNFIKYYPFYYLKLEIKKFFTFFNSETLHDLGTSLLLEKNLNIFSNIPFWSLLFALTLPFMIGKQNIKVIGLVGFLSVVVSCVIFSVTERHRLSVLPFLIPFLSLCININLRKTILIIIISLFSVCKPEFISHYRFFFENYTYSTYYLILGEYYNQHNKFLANHFFTESLKKYPFIYHRTMKKIKNINQVIKFWETDNSFLSAIGYSLLSNDAKESLLLLDKNPSRYYLLEPTLFYKLIILYKSGDIDEAARIYKKNFLYKPNGQNIYAIGYYIFKKLNDFSNAEKIKNECYKLWDETTSNFSFGHIGFLIDEYESSINFFELFNKRINNYALSHYILGLIYKKQGKITLSDEEFKKSKEIDDTITFYY